MAEKTESQDKEKIAIGSDHGGWELKEHLRAFLSDMGYQVVDFGCFTPERCDYPTFGIKVAGCVSEGRIARGILICGTGIGMSMAANRIPGIRAALCNEMFSAKMSREHNDANILCLGARVIGPGLAAEIVRTWMKSDFAGGRHQRRIDMF